MNEIFVECLFISALMIILLAVNVFVKCWKNILFYLLLGILATLFISWIYEVFFGIPKTIYLLVPYFIFVVISLFYYNSEIPHLKPHKNEDTFKLKSNKGTIEFYYPRDNFMVLGGAGSGKTASIGKPIMEQFIKYGWAGFIYDYKDYDYTQTAWNLVQKYEYPHKFYYISFTDMNHTYRFNILDKRVIRDDVSLFQAMDDFLQAMKPLDGKTDEWFQGALGLLKGVAIRFYHFEGEYARYCTLPHILNFILMASTKELTTFLRSDMASIKAAGAFLGSEGSDRTQSSIIFTINNYISNLASNRNICYVLTGNDFVFDLVDPQDPKLFAVANNFALESLISPIIAMMVPIAARRIEFGNKVKFAFVLDEMTTFKVNNFQGFPSVLREYGAAFLVLTQSSSKFDRVYGKEDRAAIMANFANIFMGKTTDVEALKTYPLYFGKEEKEKKSISAGSSSGRTNSSITRSKQKEEVYDSNAFTELRKGEFILSCGDCNVNKIKARLEMFKLEEKPLPVVRLTTNREIETIYSQIERDCEALLINLCGKI